MCREELKVGLRLCLTVLLLCAATYISANEVENRTVIIASSNNFPPVNLLENDELQGFGRDLSDAVFRSQNISVKRKHSAKWREVLEWIKSGEADVIHDTGYQQGRDQFLDYSDPILTMDEVIMVKDNRFDVVNMKSVRGKTVACVKDHITHIYLKDFDDIRCHIVETPIEGVFALLSGRVDVFIFPRQIAMYYLQSIGREKEVKIVGTPLRTLNWSMTVKEGNQELLELINEGIYEVKLSGEYDRIYNKWFGYIAARGFSITELMFSSIASALLMLVIGMLFYIKSINQEKRKQKVSLDELNSASQSLEKSENQLSTILNNIPAIVFLKDGSGKYLFVNENYRATFNKSDSNVIGKGDTEIFPPEIAGGLLNADSEVYSSGMATNYYQSFELGGRSIVLHITKFGLLTDAGKAEAVCALATDVTSRKKEEQELTGYRVSLEEKIANRTEELNNANKLLRAVLDTIPTRVFWKDTDNRYLGCNKAFAHDAGKNRPEDLLGLDDFQLPWADQAALYRSDDSEVMTTGKQRLAYEETQTTPDGKIIWLETSKIPLRTSNGTVYGVLGTYQDITERKEAEEALRNARDLAENANKSKTDFLAKMSHELRTPLHGILGFAQLGEEKYRGNEDGRISKYFSQIVTSGERLKVLLDDLLDLSKLEAGKLKLEIETCDLVKIIENCVQDQKALADRGNIKIVVNKGENIPQTRCDAARIGQVILNVLGNAMRYTPEHSTISIDVSKETLTSKAGKSRQVVRVCVEDNGPGIPPEDRDKIFDKFVQSDNQVTHKASGAGLGLAISRELIELMQGDIYCLEGKKLGACFCFELPVIDMTANDK